MTSRNSASWDPFTSVKRNWSEKLPCLLALTQQQRLSNSYGGNLYEEQLDASRSACCRDFAAGVWTKKGGRSSCERWKGNAGNHEYSRRHSAGCTRQGGLRRSFALRGQICHRNWRKLRPWGDDLPRWQGFPGSLGSSSHDGA